MQRTITVPKDLQAPLLKSLILFVVLVGLIGVMLFVRAQEAPAAGQPYHMPVSEAIEERFGVRFTFTALTAGGGFVDLRYRVIDKAKASSFGHYTETSPMIIVERSGAVIDVTRMGLHNHRVEPGRIYYVLFRNTGGALQRGDKVTIAVDDLALEHVVVQ